MYYRKMAGHASNEKLLIQLFQDSLAHTALSWYMHFGTKLNSFMERIS